MLGRGRFGEGGRGALTPNQKRNVRDCPDAQSVGVRPHCPTGAGAF